MTKKESTPMKLNFSSNIDLQTQLQLVPLNDEECIGAKILDIRNTDPSSSTSSSLVNNATLLRITQAEEDDDNDEEEEQRDDWRTRDFESIVTSLREMTVGPIIVWIELPEENDSNSNVSNSNILPSLENDPAKGNAEDPSSCDSSCASSTSEEDQDDSTVTSTDSISVPTMKPTENIASKVIKRGLLNWGTSISKHAASITSAAVEAVTVTVASNNSSGNNTNPSSKTMAAATTTTPIPGTVSSTSSNVLDSSTTVTRGVIGLPKSRHCNMYVQNDGRFVPLYDSSNTTTSGKVLLPSTSPIRPRTLDRGTSTSTFLVTNSSFLQIRLSEERPCPSDYKFQWYRSSSSTSSALEWIPIVGANKCGYQPSAIDVGKYLKCMVLLLVAVSSPSSSSEDTTNASEDAVEEVFLPSKVSASIDLFNAARQNFYNGSIFNNIKGRGKASGREFRIKIKVGSSSSSSSTHNNTTCSHLWIYQVCGSTAESLVANEVPLLETAAMVDACHPKHFDLIFSFLPEEASMVQALTETNRNNNKFTLPLLAPNRVSRESLLLALGIANYTGKPSELTSTTILFSDITIEATEENNNSPRSTLPTHQEERVIYSPSRFRALSASTTNTEEVEDLDSLVESHQPPLSPQNLTIESSILTESGSNIDNETKKKIHSMEMEIVKLTTLLTAKKDFSHSLQAQVQLLEDEIRKKDLEAEILQQDLISWQRKHQETCEILTVTQKQLQHHDSILSATKQEYSERITLLNEKTAEYKERYEEYEGMVRLLQEDKCALSEALNDRDDKLMQTEELQLSILALRKEVESKKDLEHELNNVRAANLEMIQKMEELNKCNQHLQQELEQMQSSLMKANEQVHDSYSNIASLESKMRSLDQLNHSMCMERNSYRQKAESLSKEISKICRYGLDVKQIEQLMAESERMKTQMRDLENEKRYQRAEIERLSAQYDELLDSQVKSRLPLSTREPDVLQNHSSRSLSATTPVFVADNSLSTEHKSNLERVISNLTEYLNAKEYQLETMTQVNRSLMEEVQSLTEKLNQQGRT